jgi:hypothetical protein
MGAITAIPTALLQKAGVKNETNAKLIVYGLFAIAGVVIAVIAVRQVKKFLGIGSTPVDKHLVFGTKTLTKDDAKSIAERLWNNINGNLITSFGSLMTDVPAPETLTSADKEMIYNAFGIRNSGFPFYSKGDLKYWLDRAVVFGIADAKEYWGY